MSSPIVVLEITEISENIIANEGEGVTLRCSGTGEAPVNVSWVTPSGEVNGSTSSENESGRLVPDFLWSAPELIIHFITASDGGSYTCTAENGGGSVNASVVVYITPYFTTEPTDILTTNGSIETATCIAEAFPAPEIWWVASIGNCAFLASGSGSGESLVYEHLSDNESLVFDPVVFGDEDFVYCCIVHNDFGDIYSSLSITGELLSIRAIRHDVPFCTT